MAFQSVAVFSHSDAPGTRPLSPLSSSRSSSISFGPARYDPAELRPLTTTLLVRLRYCLHALQLKQPLLARLALNELLRQEDHEQLFSRLPHPGYFYDTLQQSSFFFTQGAWRKSKVALEELQEYLDFLSIEMVRHGKHGGYIFPMSSMEERRLRLWRRMDKWTRRNSPLLEKDEHELRWKLASANPIYRDLVFFALFAQQQQRKASSSTPISPVSPSSSSSLL